MNRAIATALIAAFWIVLLVPVVVWMVGCGPGRNSGFQSGSPIQP